MMTVVTGGSKCGKSGYAEKILDKFSGKKFYIATMIPYGDEAQNAIEHHRKIRMNKGFETIEKYTDIDEIILPENNVILLECMGNLCANEMFGYKKPTNPTEKIISGVEYLNSKTHHLVVVTNNVACDGFSYEKETMKYIRILSEINQRMAEIADNVIECVYGIPLSLKGTLI